MIRAVTKDANGLVVVVADTWITKTRLRLQVQSTQYSRQAVRCGKDDPRVSQAFWCFEKDAMDWLTRI